MPQISMLPSVENGQEEGSGAIRWQDIRYDATYLYLVASDVGLRAIITVWPAGTSPGGGSGSAYTTVSLCAAEFPTFVRNGPKGPSDANVQQYISDEAGEIDAILQRRFQEAITQIGSFSAYQAAMGPDQLNVLEKINRYGACGEMGKIFATTGQTLLGKLAEQFEAQSREYLNRLNARDAHGKPLSQGGDYDYLFDSLSKVETPRPQLGGFVPARTVFKVRDIREE